MIEPADPDRDVWGRDEVPLNHGQPVAELPQRLAQLARVEQDVALSGPEDPLGYPPRPEELPEVAALAGQGWRPLRRFPLFACLPALWPAGLRGWVPDRLPHVAVIGFGMRRWVEPAQWDHDAEQARYAQTAGVVEPPPSGRLWLLRSPWDSVGVEVVCSLISQRAVQLRTGSLMRRMGAASEELLGWDEDQLWAWWPEEAHAAVARDWAEQDLTGEAVADLVAAGISAAALHELTDGPGALTRPQAVAWMRATGANVEQVLAWRARGLPAEVPAGLGNQLAYPSHAELDIWTGAGYALYDAFHLLGHDLADALELRALGLQAPEAANQLHTRRRRRERGLD